MVRLPDNWGISSNGRAPALHAGSTGIDARILHDFFFLFSVSQREAIVKSEKKKTLALELFFILLKLQGSPTDSNYRILCRAL